jgi:hypothetical protein
LGLRKISVLLLAILLVALVSAHPAEAASQVQVSWQLNVGKGIYYQTWNSLQVTIANAGNQDIQGSVEVRWGGIYRQELFLEQGKTMTMRFFLPPAEVVNNFFSQSSDVEVVVREASGRNLSRSVIPMSGMPLNHFNVGVLAPSLTPFQRLYSLDSNIHVTRVQGADFDNYLYLDNFKILIFSDPGTIQLRPEQMENLSTWVKRGGLLVIGGGSKYRQTQAQVPQALLPVVGSGTAVQSLSDLIGPIKFVDLQDREFLMVTGTLQGEVILSTPAHPLLVSRNLGRGQVIWSALDLEAAPLDNATNGEAFWRVVVQRASGNSAGLDTWRANSIFNIILSGGIGTSAMSPLKAFLGLIFYIALLGPANFILLKKFKRWEWSWVTIPSLAILFTSVIFIAGSTGRSSEYTAYQFNILELEGNQAYASSFSGLFIPRRGSKTLETSLANLAVSGGNIRQNNKVFLVSPPVWSVQKFYGADLLNLPGGIDMQLTLEGSRLNAVVTNRTGIAIFDSFIRFGFSDFPLGALAPGASAQVDLGGQGQSFDLQAVLARYNDSGQFWWGGDSIPTYDAPLTFYGFSETPDVLALQGIDDYRALNLIVRTATMEDIALQGQSIDIKPGWLIPRFISNAANFYRPHYSGGEYVVEGQGSLDLIFSLPKNLDPAQGKFFLNFHNVWGSLDSGALTVWNPQTNSWNDLSRLPQDFRGGLSYSLDNMTQWGAQGNVRVRMSFGAQSHLGFSPRGIDLTLEGGRIND